MNDQDTLLAHAKRFTPKGVEPRTFWTFQLVFWSAVYIWRTAFTYAYGYGFKGADLRLISITAAILLTLALAFLIVHVLRDRLEVLKLLLITLLGAAVAIAHTAGDRLLYTSAENSWQWTAFKAEVFFEIFSVNAWVFLSWTAFFIVILQFSRLREREHAIQRLKETAKDARLETLVKQLNPHFLFNTLNSLSALIASGRPADADRMILKLSRFLRHAIDANQEQKICLANELRFAQDYLDIQKVRFDDRLTYAFDVDETCNEMLVPPLLLQPIVENALKHGLEPSSDVCHVLVSAKCRNGRLILSVSDTGAGFTFPAMEGAGLRLIRDRLDAHYEGDAFLELTQGVHGGALVRVELAAEASGRTGRQAA